MSNIYNLEPPTKGKVMLMTSMGEIEIELWPKEAPLAVRNFLQLCLEGYYDGTLFHRIIEGFMIQGGDPTATGEGGESVYGKPFKDEFHSRLRFTHRGLVACANQNKPDTNGSQFFITLDRCEDLNKRYTIFGRVVGDTIYNVTRIGEVLTDKDSRPIDPVVVTTTEVVWNPFDDIVPRMKEPVPMSGPGDDKIERQGKKDLKLLSFGDEAEEDDVEIAAIEVSKIRSAHDALENDATLLITDTPEAQELKAQEEAKRQADLQHVRTILRKDDAGSSYNRNQDGNMSQGEKTGAERMGLEEKMQARVDEMRKREIAKKNEGNEVAAVSPEPVNEEAVEAVAVDKKPSGSTKDRLHLKRKSLKSEDVKDADLLTNSQIQRAKYKRRKQLHGDRETDTLARLSKFKSSLSVLKKAGSPEKASGGDQEDVVDEAQQKAEERMDMPAAWRIDDYLKDGEDVGLSDLTSHRLQFKGAEKKDEMSRRDDVDDYVVFDPLLEAGKSKFNKKQQEAKRKNREWTVTKSAKG